MSNSSGQEFIQQFINFFEEYCEQAITELTQQYLDERRSLYVDYDDLYQFDSELAEDYLSQPDQIREYAEEALRLYDAPGETTVDDVAKDRSPSGNVRVVNVGDSIERPF